MSRYLPIRPGKGVGCISEPDIMRKNTPTQPIFQASVINAQYWHGIDDLI